jgi:uncharacterized protein (UPF0335 family)
MISCGRCDTGALPAPGQNLPEGWQMHALSRGKGSYAVCATCLPKMSDSTRATGNAAADQLRLLIERWERLQEEKKGIADDQKDVMLEAKSCGYDTKGMMEIIKLRAMSPHDRAERDAIIETYRASLGMD